MIRIYTNESDAFYPIEPRANGSVDPALSRKVVPETSIKAYETRLPGDVSNSQINLSNPAVALTSTDINQ